MATSRIVDPGSHDWRRIKEHLEKRIEELRCNLEPHQSPEDTLDKRARLRELRSLIEAIEGPLVTTVYGQVSIDHLGRTTA